MLQETTSIGRGRIGSIKESIRSCGVTVLEGDSVIVTVGGQKLRLCGVDDPDGFGSHPYTTDHAPSKSWRAQFDACRAQTGDAIYTVLLSPPPRSWRRRTGTVALIW